MVDKSNVLPQIIRAEYDPGNAFPRMIADAKGAAGQIRGEFDRAMGDGKLFKVNADKGVFDQLAREAGRLHAQLDPTYAAQQRFNEAMDRADVLLRAGAIGQRTYAQAAAQARDALQQEHAALFRTAEAARQGTTANHLVANSSRAVRTATLQAGQQMQDLGIMLYSGQRASIAFAQQLPQLAFALTALEGSANKTHDRIGRFATFLSGPWGLAVGLGVGVAVELAASLLDVGQKSEDAQGKVYDFSRGLNVLALSAKEAASAMAQLADATKAAIAEQGDFLNQQSAAADVNVARLRTTIAARKEALEAAQAEAARYGATPAGLAGAGPALARAYMLRKDIAELEKALQSALGAQASAEIARAQRDVIGNMDASAAATTRYAEALGRLESQRRLSIQAEQAGPLSAVMRASVPGGYVSDAQYRAEFEKLRRDRDAAIKAARDAQRSAGGPSASAQASAGDMTALLKQLFGSGTRVLPNSRHGKYTSTGRISDHFYDRALDFIPEGGMGRYTTAQVEEMLKTAGVDIRRNRSGTQQLFGPGRSANRPGDHNNHFHMAWQGGAPDPDRVAETAQRKAQQAAEELSRLIEFGREAGVTIQQLNDRFNDTPPAVMQSRAAMEQINDLIGQLQDKRPPGFEAMVKSLNELKPAAEALVNGPFNDMIDAANEQAAVQDLLIAGREDEAEVLRRQFALEKQMAPLTEQQMAALRALVKQERERSREQEKQNALRQRELALIEGAQANIRETAYELLQGKGIGAVGNLFKRQWDMMLRDMAESVTEGLFSDFFDDRSDEVRNANVAQAGAANAAAKSLYALAEAADAAAGVDRSLENEFDRAFGRSAPANDNGPAPVEITNPEDIMVVARKELRSLLGQAAKTILGDKLYKDLGGKLDTIAQGAALGQVSSGLARSLGIRQSSTGASAGGALGSAFFGPVGGLAGGLLGGTIGGLFKSTPRGSSTLTSIDQDIDYKGSGRLKDSVTAFAGNVQESLANIIESLGGEAGAFSVSVGQRKKNYVVDPTGQGRTKGSGVLKFKTEEEAARAALRDAIVDGAVKGIKEGAKRLLLAGQDIDKALAKAVKFQNVFDELDALKDPLGHAVRELNREFEGLISIFREAGASSEEWAQLQELYGLKREELLKSETEALKQANEEVKASLQSLIDELSTGDFGLSLRDRLANAHLIYDPMAQAIREGKAVDADKFSEAARTVLDLARQLYGSQTAYFQQYDEVLALSRLALATANAATVAVDTAKLPESPFANLTVDTVPVVSAIDAQSQMLLGQLTLTNEQLAQISAQLAANNNTAAPAAAANF